MFMRSLDFKHGAPRHSARGLLDSSLLLRPHCLPTDLTPGAGGWHGCLAYRRAGGDWRPICCNLEQVSGSGWRAWVRKHPAHVFSFPSACSYWIVDFLPLFLGFVPLLVQLTEKKGSCHYLNISGPCQGVCDVAFMFWQKLHLSNESGRQCVERSRTVMVHMPARATAVDVSRPLGR